MYQPEDEQEDFLAKFDSLCPEKANEWLFDWICNRQVKLLEQLSESRPVLEFRSYMPDNPSLVKNQGAGKDLSGKAYLVSGAEEVKFALRNWSMRDHKYSGQFILAIDDPAEHDRKRRTLVEKLQDPDIAMRMDNAVELAWKDSRSSGSSNKTRDIDVFKFARTAALHFTADYFGMPVDHVLDEQGLAKWSSEAFKEYIWKIHARHFVQDMPDSRQAIQSISKLLRDSFNSAPASSVIGRFRYDPGAFVDENGNMDKAAVGANIIGCIQGLIDNVTISACNALDQLHILSSESYAEKLNEKPLFGRQELIASAAEQGQRALDYYLFVAHQHNTPSPFLPRFASSKSDINSLDKLVPEGAHISCAVGPAVKRINAETDDRFSQDCRMGIGAHDCIGKYVGDQLVLRMLRKVLLAGDITRVELKKEWGWLISECSATVSVDNKIKVKSVSDKENRTTCYVNAGETSYHAAIGNRVKNLLSISDTDIPYLTNREIKAVSPASLELLSSAKLNLLTHRQIANLGFAQCMKLDEIRRNRSDLVFNKEQMRALTERISYFAVMSKTRVAKTRPHPYSLWNKNPQSVNSIHDFVTWPGLVDKSYTARHLPPTSEGTKDALPVDSAYDSSDEHGAVTALFKLDTQLVERKSRSSLLFPMFAQWFTDSFLRTDRLDRRKTTSSHHVDMCQIYGTSDEVASILRTNKKGRLKSEIIGDREFPPRLFDEHGNVKSEFKQLPYILNGHINAVLGRSNPLASRKKYFLASGLARGNATFGNAAMNTLFLREHNRLCGLLENENKHWDDERLFQTTRLIVILLELKIVITEYINHIASPPDVDPKAMARRIFRFDSSYAEQQSWYRPNHISVEFNLLYRWHCLVPESVRVAGKTYPLEQYINNNGPLIVHGLDGVLLSASKQSINKPGLFSTPAPLLRAEYEALKMSRDFRVQPYNAYREYFDLPKLESFEELGCKPAIVDKLNSVYPDGVDTMDFLVGLYAEGHEKDGNKAKANGNMAKDKANTDEVFGELMTLMVAHDAFTQVLTNPLLSKNVLDEGAITDIGQRALEDTNSLNDLWQRNRDCKSGTAKSGEKITMDI